MAKLTKKVAPNVMKSVKKSKRIGGDRDIQDNSFLAVLTEEFPFSVERLSACDVDIREIILFF